MPSPSFSFVYSITPPPASSGTSAPTTNADQGFVDLALDLATWDLETPVRLVSGDEMIAQRLAIRFRFWLGEWFLDTRQGVPYVEKILVANPDLVPIRAIFRRVITSTPGVARLRSLDLRVDRAARRLIIDSFEAELTSGAVLQIEAPFIVNARD